MVHTMEDDERQIMERLAIAGKARQVNADVMRYSIVELVFVLSRNAAWCLEAGRGCFRCCSAVSS